MTDKVDKYSQDETDTTEDTDEVSLEEIEAEPDDDELIMSVDEPKTAESVSTINADDSVKIYLQQIGKIPL